MTPLGGRTTPVADVTDEYGVKFAPTIVFLDSEGKLLSRCMIEPSSSERVS